MMETRPIIKDPGQDYEFYKELYIVMDSDKLEGDLTNTCWQFDADGHPIDPIRTHQGLSEDWTVILTMMG